MSTPDEVRALADLVGETEIRDVRLTGIAAEVHVVPSEMAVDFRAGEVEVGQSADEITAKFEHSARFKNTGGDTVATISFTHTARFTYREGLVLDNDSVRDWVFGNVYFMVYPYVRQSLQDACLRLGLPAVVLGYLKRGEITPEAISLLVSTVSLVQKRGEDQPLPIET